MKTPNIDTHHFATQAIHAGEIHDPSGAHIAPIYQTSTFVFDDTQAVDDYVAGRKDGFMYARSRHPGRRALAAKIAALEGYNLIKAARAAGQTGEVVAGEIFASGMAAINATLMGIAKAGQHIIAQDVLYGSTEHLVADVLPQFGISHSLVPRMEPELLEMELERHPNTAAIHLETPANPTMTLVDIALTAEIAHAHNALLVVDNTFATPVLQRPLELGADVVVHSTTKYINGHGTVIGGAVVCKDVALLKQKIYPLLRFQGAVPSPFDCWLTNLGLKTLPLRMKQHCANAMKVARFLEGHPAIETIYYPGLESFPQHALAQRQMDDFGAMIALEVKGGLAAVRRVLDRVQLCALGVSLGTVDTLIQHPASMTHAVVPPDVRLAQGITDGLLRISVGIEDVADILADLEQALQR
jgi:methionine-gamma-lyase